MSTFVQMLDKIASSSPALRGENDTLEYSADQVGDYLVAFFFALVRDLPDDRLLSLYHQCVDTARLQPRVSTGVLADLFVLAFQTRDCRGGKGERALFHKLFLRLYSDFPSTTLRALPLIAHYGSYKDYVKLLAMLDEKHTETEGEAANAESFPELQKAIIALLAQQLQQDSAALRKHEENAGEEKKEEESKTDSASPSLSLSLCAKYAPREGSSFETKHKRVYKLLLAEIFPEVPEKQRNAVYRKQLAALNRALDVVETKMCAHNFASIDFAKVPALCMSKYRKAFLNEKLDAIPTTAEENEKGNRRPEDEDRVLSRHHLRDTVLNRAHTIKGGQMYPHELSRKYMMHSKMSTLEKDVIQAQWDDLRAQIQRKLEEKREERAAAAAATGTETAASSESTARPVDLGRLVPLVDVSGSMGGTPMEVAIALGILISEMNQPAFRDRMITFSANPTWVSFAKCVTLEDKVHLAQGAEWGMNTDIEKAFALIERVIEENKLPAEEIPDLIIFSDMQFDAAAGQDYQLTQLQRIRRRFHDLGVRLTGHPYAAPRIIFWNLRGDTEGFPATAQEENVQMLSGYSPALFNALVSGETAAVAATTVNAAGETVPAQATVTPYDTMRSVLDDERYDNVREVLSASDEGPLASYSFKRVAPADDAMDIEDTTHKKPKFTPSRGAGRGAGRGRGRGRGRR